MLTSEQLEVMRELSRHQRKCIADIIRGADCEVKWHSNSDGSWCDDDAEETLKHLAMWFEKWDDFSVTDD